MSGISPGIQDTRDLANRIGARDYVPLKRHVSRLTSLIVRRLSFFTPKSATLAEVRKCARLQLRIRSRELVVVNRKEDAAERIFSALLS